jgi:hypothetical protein
MGFKRFDAQDFVVSADAVQSTAWSTDEPTLTTFFTSSAQKAASSGNYYISVYQSNPTTAGSLVQFDITYGNKFGSGSTSFDVNYPQYSPSSTVYGQYRTMILEDENSSFIFGEGDNTLITNDFYVLSMDRARFKESIFPGTLNLKLTGAGGDHGTIHLTDNSNSTTLQTFMGSSRVLQLVSGSNGSSVTGGGYVPGSGSYGLVFPELGTIILNPDAINQSIGISPNRSSNLNNQVNADKVFTFVKNGASFTMNSQETITSDYIFIRSRNSEFNYSSNPSFISGSTGEVVFQQFINNPQTYITTVGMYNDANECIAVAKLSRPLEKDFTKESLIRVKLDF